MPEQFFTVKEAAAWLNARGIKLTEGGVRRLCRDNELATVQFGRVYRIPLSELIRITTPQKK
jgi:excisionase family DNA binding protein